MVLGKNRLKDKKPPESHFVSIVVFKGLGKTWRFNIYFPLLIGLLVAGVLYGIFSLALLAQYITTARDYDAQEKTLEALNQECEENRLALYRAEQRLKFLGYIDPETARIGGSQLADKLEPNDKDESLSKEAHPGSPKSSVTISNVAINSGSTSLTVSFRLKKRNPGRKAIRGNVFVIALNPDLDPAELWPYPKVALQNGMPVEPKKGESFKIRNYRKIRARWSLVSMKSTPSRVRIVVYDSLGILLLKKEFPVEK